MFFRSFALLLALCASGTALAQIRYFTRHDDSAMTPATSAAARAHFASLPDGVDGYGCVANRTSFDQTTNQLVFSGPKKNLAYYSTVPFVVGPNQGGTWDFRFGADYGFGGTLLIDGVEVSAGWYNLWWDQNFDTALLAVPPQALAGPVTLAPGLHILETFGFEDCCDGVAALEVRRAGDDTYRTVATALLTMPALSCQSEELLVVPSTSFVASGGKVTVTFAVSALAATNAGNVQFELELPVGVTLDPSGPIPSATTANTATYDAVIASYTSTVLSIPLLLDDTLPDGTSLELIGRYQKAMTVLGEQPLTLQVANQPVLDLAITASPTLVEPGDQVTYALDLSNLGAVNALNCSGVFTLPTTTTYVADTTGGVYDPNTRTVTVNLGPLLVAGAHDVGRAIIVSVDGNAPNASTLALAGKVKCSNSASVDASGGAKVRRLPALTLADAPDPVEPGGTITYTVTASAPFGAEPGKLVLANPDTAAVLGSFDVPAIAPGVPAVYTATYDVPGNAANGSQVHATLTPTYYSTLAAVTATTTVATVPHLALTITCTPSEVAPNVPFTCHAKVKNGGTGDATKVVLEIELPVETTFVSSPTGTFDGGTGLVSVTVGTLAVGASATLDVVAKPKSNVPDGTPLILRAQVAAANTTCSPESTTVTVKVVPPDLAGVDETPPADLATTDLVDLGGVIVLPDLTMKPADMTVLPDLVTPPDLTVVDLIVPPDLVVVPDLTALPDLLVLPDLTSEAPDLVALADLTTAPDDLATSGDLPTVDAATSDLESAPDLGAPADMKFPYSVSGGGCGCSTTPTRSDLGTFAIAVVLVIAFARPRRRRA